MKLTWLIYFLIIIVCLVIFSNNMYQPIYNSIKEGVDNTSIINLPDQAEKPNPVTIFFNEKPQILESNIAISFDINIRSICNYGWQQVIGVTPDKNGSDKRVLGIWFEPNSTTLHIRTATTSNGINITDSNSDIGGNKINLNNYIGKFVNICVIGNLNDNSYTHTFTVYIDGILKITTTIPRCWYPIVTKQVYIMTQYKQNDGITPSYYSFNGKLGNVVFLSSNSPLTYNRVKEYVPSFYTDSDSFTNINNTYKEGMTEKIIGIGVAPNISDYEPIKDSQDKPVCPVTTLYNNQDNTNFKLLDENKNYQINGKKIPICSFDEILKIEEIILKKINKFNTDYSDYMIYKYNQNHKGDCQPQLAFVNPTDDLSSLNRYDEIPNVKELPTYKDLSKSLQTYDNILDANKQYYPTIQTTSTTNNTTLHNEIKTRRNDLDNKLFELNNNQNTIHRESKLLMDSSIYVTILWTTLATSLVYYMFVHI